MVGSLLKAVAILGRANFPIGHIVGTVALKIRFRKNNEQSNYLQLFYLFDLADMENYKIPRALKLRAEMADKSKHYCAAQNKKKSKNSSKNSGLLYKQI